MIITPIDLEVLYRSQTMFRNEKHPFERGNVGRLCTLVMSLPDLASVLLEGQMWLARPKGRGQNISVKSEEF